jgi:lipopolysaccharide biosynthesis glycosyltransferase
MKAYAFYTSPVKDWLDLLIESSEEFNDLEVVPILGQTDSTNDLAGATHSQDYMKLMLSRWLNLPNIIRENIGNNILFLDCDIVFNKYKKDFVSNINSFLEDHDLVTQYDTNSGMSLGINMGFLGIKCTEETLEFFSEFMQLISRIKNPNAGYPQIEFNNHIKYLETYDTANMPAYKVLPQDYGYLTSNCYFYHAIGIPGHQGKSNAMRSAMENFKNKSNAG